MIINYMFLLSFFFSFLFYVGLLLGTQMKVARFLPLPLLLLLAVVVEMAGAQTWCRTNRVVAANGTATTRRCVCVEGGLRSDCRSCLFVSDRHASNSCINCRNKKFLFNGTCVSTCPAGTVGRNRDDLFNVTTRACVPMRTCEDGVYKDDGSPCRCVIGCRKCVSGPYGGAATVCTQVADTTMLGLMRQKYGNLAPLELDHFMGLNFPTPNGDATGTDMSTWDALDSCPDSCRDFCCDKVAIFF